MIRFRIRLYRDLRDIKAASNRIIPRAQELAKNQPEEYGQDGEGHKDNIAN
jgi:hypothetical protein